jgi:AraC-like DNA-binding protein
VAVASLARVEGAVALLSLLIVHLLESPQRWLSAGNEHEPSCVASAKTFLKTHSLDESCLSDVARHVGLSGDYLGRIFRKATGATVGEYIARMRVERVKAMLPDPSCRIIEAAFAAGFQSVAQFNRVFKRYAGMSPSEYRSSLM